MTLRSDVRAAVDDLAPRAPTMRDEVIAAALSATRAPAQGGRRKGLGFPIRPFGLAAAAMIAVLLVATVLVGGRALRDWQTYTERQHELAVFQSQLADLRTRTLALPSVTGSQPCPESATGSEFDFGNGPVFANGGGQINNPWGYFFDVTYYTSPDLKGPVLIRGEDLLHGTRIVFLGPYASGKVVGTVRLQGVQQLHSELVLDAGHPPARTADGYGMFAVRQGVPLSFTGCFGFQIDGPDFAEQITGDEPPTGGVPSPPLH